MFITTEHNLADMLKQNKIHYVEKSDNTFVVFVPNTAKQSLWTEYYLKAKMVAVFIAKKGNNKLEVAKMWMLNLTEDEAKIEDDSLLMTIDAPAAMDMVVHLRKEFADDGLFKAAAKIHGRYSQISSRRTCSWRSIFAKSPLLSRPLPIM